MAEFDAISDVEREYVVIEGDNHFQTIEGKRKNQSSVWRWFCKNNREEAMCVLCTKTLRTKTGSTTALKRHMENHHTDVWRTDERADHGVLAENMTVPACNRKVALLNKDSPRAKEMTNAIAELIVADCQPFSVVTDEGFKNLLKIAEPRYQIPSRATFSEEIIPAMFKLEQHKLKKLIAKDSEIVRSFAFTTDSWTSRANDNYVSLTVHYLNDAFHLKNYTLKITSLREAHTSDHVHEMLRDVIREWGLSKNHIQIYFVTDNAANIVKAIKLNNTWERIPCFAHTLQLVIKDGVKKSAELVALLKKCRSIVSFFRRSASADEKLRKEQEKQFPNTKALKLINDVDTRWNSQFEMLGRLLKVRCAINAVLCEPRMPDNLTSREWSRIEDYCNSLKIFKEATDLLTMENTCTLSRYIPVIYGLEQKLKHLINSRNSNNDGLCPTTDFKKDLLTQVESRFEFINSSKTLTIAMILDPRVKNRLLSEKSKVWAHNLLHSIAIEYLDLSAQTGTETTIETSASSSLSLPSSSSSSTSTGSLFDFLADISKKEEQQQHDVYFALENEEKMYIEERLIKAETCIFEWWKENAPRFPNIAVIAQNILGIPAAQAYSERLFSKAGNIITEKRTCLLSERVEHICFLSANSKSRNSTT